jgi:hypothetical protein
MDPMRMVIHNANLSCGVILSAASLFMSLGGFQRLMTSASDGGRASAVAEVVLMIMDSVAICVSRVIVAVIRCIAHAATQRPLREKRHGASCFELRSFCEKGRKAESPDYWGITRKSAYIVTTDILLGTPVDSWAPRLTITLRTRSSSEEARAKSAFLISDRMRRISVSNGSCSVP